MQVDTDPAAHADHNRLAVHGLQPLLKMFDQIRGDQPDAFGIANQCLQSRPFGFQLFAAGLLFAFGNFIELLIQPGSVAMFSPSFAIRLS